MADRPSTPPRSTKPGSIPKGPLTPEQVRRLEVERLKAKALAQRADAARPSTTTTTPSGFPVSLSAGQKRPHSSISTSHVPRTQRDARNSPASAGGSGPAPAKDANLIRPAKKFDKYIEYDFSKMTDTRGGFLSAEDDPHNRAMQHPRPDAAGAEAKPAHMTLAEWERHQLLKKLRAAKQGPFEPGISALGGAKEAKKCDGCGGLEIDWKWEEVFGVAVCGACKEKYPEKYSLLTKTEAKEDYLLTDEELKDPELLPHLERPNPHKATWNNMMLYLRCQVEAHAFSPRKWGSPEALDAEFERRQAENKRRKDKRFADKLAELKKKTRVEAFRKSRRLGEAGGGDARFGDEVGAAGGKHVHEWGATVEDPETGMSRKSCVACGMEVEELVF